MSSTSCFCINEHQLFCDRPFFGCFLHLEHVQIFTVAVLLPWPCLKMADTTIEAKLGTSWPSSCDFHPWTVHELICWPLILKSLLRMCVRESKEESSVAFRPSSLPVFSLGTLFWHHQPFFGFEQQLEWDCLQIVFAFNSPNCVTCKTHCPWSQRIVSAVDLATIQAQQFQHLLCCFSLYELGRQSANITVKHLLLFLCGFWKKSSFIVGGQFMNFCFFPSGLVARFLHL